MFISIGDNMAQQLDLFEHKTRTSLVQNFVDDHSGNFTDDVIDMINERLTELFNDEDIGDYDIQADIAFLLMKRISENLQLNPEDWI